MKTIVFPAAVVALILHASAGLSATDLPMSWKEDTYQGGPFKKLLVIAVTPDLERRRLFEDAFVKVLQLQGVDAVASLSALGPDVPLERNIIEPLIQNLNVDGVLVTKLIGIKRDYGAGEQKNLYAHYEDAVQQARMPEYLKSVTVRLESNLFSAGNSQLVWFAVSDSMNPDSLAEIIEEVQGKSAQNLKENNLI